jgi:hypothetical protein
MFPFGVVMSWLRTLVKEWGDTIRFLVWVLGGLWALVAAIAANLPQNTYRPPDAVVRIPPTESRPLSLKCPNGDVAKSYKVFAANPTANSGPVYTAEATPNPNAARPNGYSVSVINGGGASNPRRDDLDVHLSLVCEAQEGPIYSLLQWPFRFIASFASAKN